MPRPRRFWPYVVLFSVGAFLVLISSSGAWAVLTPAGGVDAGIGRIEHGVFPVAGAFIPAQFDPLVPFFSPSLATGGALHTPGFGYPSIAGGSIFEVDTGGLGLLPNVPVFLNTLPNLPSGFGGAATTMVGVGGAGRAGVAATNMILRDLNTNAFASTNTFGASVVYNNVGGPLFTRFGHALASRVNVPLGGYAAAGVKSIFEIGDYNPVTGGFVVNAFWEPAPILVAFDGALGARPDAIQGQFFSFLPVGQSLTFGAVSTTPFALIPAGKSVRMRSTVTLIADPETDFELIDLPADLVAEMQGRFLGLGAASNADSWLVVPEPATLGLLGPMLAALVLRRKGRKR